MEEGNLMYVFIIRINSGWSLMIINPNIRGIVQPVPMRIKQDQLNHLAFRNIEWITDRVIFRLAMNKLM